jgi:hypothetical protein
VKNYLIVALLLAGCRRASDLPIDTSSVFSSADSVRAADSGGAPADSADARSCGVSAAPVLEEDGIGELKQGRPVADIVRLCDVISDSRQPGQEGTTERVLVVRIANETVRAIVVDDRVFRIEVNSPRFRTTDSLGVDTPLRRIAAMRGAQFAPGEDGVYGFSSDHCGLSFRFSVPSRPPSGSQWTAALINEAHGDAAVNRVIVIPCRR